LIYESPAGFWFEVIDAISALGLGLFSAAKAFRSYLNRGGGKEVYAKEHTGNL